MENVRLIAVRVLINNRIFLCSYCEDPLPQQWGDFHDYLLALRSKINTLFALISVALGSTLWKALPCSLVSMATFEVALGSEPSLETSQFSQPVSWGPESSFTVKGFF